jgi:signal transduction histidine kinase
MNESALEVAEPDRSPSAEPRLRRELELLLALSDAVNRALSLEEVFEPALAAMTDGLRVDRAAILITDEDGVMRFRAWRGLSDEYRRAVDGHSPWRAGVAQAPHPIFVGDVSTAAAMAPYAPIFAAEQIAALGFIPLFLQGRLLGKFMVYARQRRAFSAHDERLAQAIALQISQAIIRSTLIASERRERAHAERLAERSRALQEVTAALSKVSSVSEVAEVIVTEGSKLARAATAGVWLLDRDRTVLELAASLSYSNAAPFRRLPVDTPHRVPVLDAVGTREPIFFRDRAAFRGAYPEVERVAAVRPELAIACLPMVVEGRCLGALAFTFDEAREFSPDERDPLLVLARHCAQAISRAQHFDLETQARAQAEAAQERASLLLEASALLSSSLDFAETLQRLARLVVPRMADWCAVELATEPDRPSEQLVVAHVDPAKVALAHELRRRWPPDPTARHGVAQALRTGTSQLYAEITDQLLASTARDAEHLRVVRELGFTSAMVVPMLARERTFGAITFVSAESGRRYAQADLELAELLARRAATAIENALLFGAAQEAIRAREKVLAVVSHDLRNPLNAVQLAAQVLVASGDCTPAVRRSGELIQRATERMARLIQDLLDFSVLQNGRLQVVPKPCTVEEILQATLEIFGPLARERDIGLDVHVSSTERGLICDRDRVVQALGNLVSNAIQVTPAEAHVTVWVTSAEGEHHFTVEDSGRGIAAEDLPRLFEPYWRADKTTYKGTGLGLTIARGIVEAHGGRLWAESTVGAGSRFTFSLPPRAPT